MSHPVLRRTDAIKLWLHCQGLTRPRTTTLTPETLTDVLTKTGGLQLDAINTVERAHYLTLWSRFGAYDRTHVDNWLYSSGLAYEYWGHEASLLPISHLPLGLRRMRRFPPSSWKNSSWWEVYQVPTGVKRRVLKRLRVEGPLGSESIGKRGVGPREPGMMPLPKEERRALNLLWHAGRIAVRLRKNFRCMYDLAERVYPVNVEPASSSAYLDSWLHIGLRGNGVASENHMRNYWTAPKLSAPERRMVIERNLRRGDVVAISVEGSTEPHYILPEHLDLLSYLPAPEGTTLICPFDSLLWQRQRSEDFWGFKYRIEIYVPASKRIYGYYVFPILHDGNLVGRMDIKMHRKQRILEVKAVYLEEQFSPAASFYLGVRNALQSLGQFLGAEKMTVPHEWGKFL